MLFKRKMKMLARISIFVCLLVIDQLAKYLSVIQLKDTSGIVLIPDVFELQYIENRGAAFGILQEQRFLLIAVSILILAVLYCLYRKIPEEKRYLPIRFIMIFITAGAIGNMIDRIYHGYVVDFLYFRLINFPVFNIADCYVVISVISAFFLICFYYSEDELHFLWKSNER